jgi:hypothetical protein
MPKPLNISYQFKDFDKSKLTNSLIIKVANYFGTSINSKGDAEMLSLNISRRKGIQLSANTIRRIYGLLPPTKPSASTLDKLSNCIGFKSFEQYAHKEYENNIILINSKSIQEPIDLIIQNTKEDELSLKDIVYLAFITNQALNQADNKTVAYIFSNRKLHKLITSNEDLHDTFAQLIGPNILVPHYIKNPKILFDLPYFQDLILSKYVDTENNDLSVFYRFILTEYMDSPYFNLASSVLALNYLYLNKLDESKFYFKKIYRKNIIAPELLGRFNLLKMIHECKDINWLIEESKDHIDQLHLYSIDIASYFSRTKNKEFIYRYYSEFRPFLFVHQKMISYELIKLYSACYNVFAKTKTSTEYKSDCGLNSNTTYLNLIQS